VKWFIFRDRYERQTIEAYFYDGFRYSSIVRFLREYHGIDISQRTLRRRLLDYGLCRRMQPSALPHIWNAIRIELQGPGIRCFVVFTVCHFRP